MKKKLKRQILSMLLVLVCVLNMGITVFADEEYDSGMTKEEVIEKYSVHTGNKQADAVFYKYLEKASDVMVNEQCAGIISSCESLDSLYEEFYITYGKGTHEKWIDMTTFEKILQFDLYITPMLGMAQYSYDSAFGTLEIYLDKVCRDIYRMYEQVDIELAEAYYEIMEWQYYYITENRAVYNFMTGEDSLGNTKIEEIEEVKLTEENSLGDTLKEKISEVKQEIEEEDAKEQENIQESMKNMEQEEETKVVEADVNADDEVDEEDDARDETAESMKNMLIVFVMLIVVIVALVVALLVLIIQRKNAGKK